jgi:hypothetical protein
MMAVRKRNYNQKREKITVPNYNVCESILAGSMTE